MTSIIAPRPDQPLVGANGIVNREWYKYLVLLGNSVGPSLTAIQDVQLDAMTEDASNEAQSLRALRRAEAAEGLFLLERDAPKPPDDNIFTFWPWG